MRYYGITRTFRILFYIIASLFFLDVFELFQTKIGIVKSILYYGVLILPVPLLLLEFKVNPKMSESKLKKTIPVLIIIVLIYLNPVKIIFHTGTWKTQVVEQISRDNSNHRVELQMKDMGALGYSKRKAEVIYLTDFFYFVASENYDFRNFLGTDWNQVDQNVNEMGLKE
jgi:hypothetical protein